MFSSKVGLAVNGAANYISGTHIWFPENQALAFAGVGVMAFHITSGQNRFSGCYIDGSRAVFENGGLSGNVWTNGFECCAGAPGPHGVLLLGDAIGPGLVIVNNEFRGGDVYWQPKTNGTTAKMTGTRIESNSFTGGARGSRATASLTQTAAAQWAFDFCAQLVVPSIDHVASITLQAAAGFATAVARAPAGCTLLVETSEPVSGTVTVTVDSSAISADFV